MGGNLPPQLAAARAAVREAVAAWQLPQAQRDDYRYDDDAPRPAATPPARREPTSLEPLRREPQRSDSPRIEPPRVLVACSGGADSLALAVTCAFLASRGRLAAGAVVVDHGLQAGSADAARRAADQLTDRGLSPVEVLAVDVPAPGTEEQARAARYAALEAAARRWETAEPGPPVAVLTGHTLSDQAEQVLLGLARGSGTRSLAGIPARRGRFLRPFLGTPSRGDAGSAPAGTEGRADGLWRADTEAICAHERLQVWHDPTNAERDALRNRVRLDVLPYLERELGGGVAANLARTAALAAADADHLDAEAEQALAGLRLPPGGSRSDTGAPASGDVVLRLPAVRDLDAALRPRVLRLAVRAAGGEAPTFERTAALERLAVGRGSAGPVQLAGHVAAYRVRDGRGHGFQGPVLVLRRVPVTA
ncbi:tRNA lysidine(34) synthetase [Zhihengliuella sp.]|uniref:tRNA lysidine(34) synthetase n=1 Tax=Zhihengliuella sp. TaxID=1954483 RepID=UPI002811FB42|nr:tRNA lysidine(34) synthetase [Zhihengliuella sp.]